MKKSHRSPNFEERRGGASPSLVILHYTGMRSGREALARLCDPDSKVSAHYMVDEDGTVYALVDEDKRAWHAGASYWAGERDINSHSIGIEIVNPGHEFGYRPFPEAQIGALEALLEDVMIRNGIMPPGVLGHSDIAPARKQDPGEMFPWRRIASRGLSLWPETLPEDIGAAAEIEGNEALVHELLAACGYDPLVSCEDCVTAFHRRLRPELFVGDGHPGRMGRDSVAMLLALVRLSHARQSLLSGPAAL